MGTPFGSQRIFPFGGPDLILPMAQVNLRIETMVILHGTKDPEGLAVIKFHIIELSKG
jgi:hypothetical protein